MKKIFTLIFVSALGGALTLGAYKLFIENDNTVAIEHLKSTPFTIPVNYNTNNSPLVKSETIDFTSAAEKTINTVVHVKNTTTSKGQNTFEDLFFGKRSQRPQIGTGSGVIFSPDGLIITNNHVIEGAQSISVTLNNNKTYEAKLIGTDSETDIALLKIDTDEDLPFTTFGDSDNAKIGEWVLAVGNPFNLTSTVTAGIISAKSRDLSGGNIQSFIQTDAAVNPGNSGGALVNTNGELIGINTAITSQTGSYVGYSFAVPSNIAKKVVEDIMEFGNVQNGILGVSGGSLNSSYAKTVGVEETEGFFVDSVEKNSGAEVAGIKKGDVIKKLDDIKISKFSDLKGFLNTKRPNDVVNVRVLRDGVEKTFPVRLSNIEISAVKFMDVEFRNLNDKMKEAYDTKIGVFVSQNKNSKLYKAIGLNRGQVITAINGKSIKSIKDISTLKEKYGDAFEDKINSIELIDRTGQKKQFIFR